MKTTPLDDQQTLLVRSALAHLPPCFSKAITIEQVEDRILWSFDRYADLCFEQVTANSWRVLGSKKTIGIHKMTELLNNFA